MKNEIKLNESQYKIFQKAYTEYDYMISSGKEFDDYMDIHTRKGEEGQRLEASYYTARVRHVAYVNALSEWLGIETTIIQNAIESHYNNLIINQYKIGYYPSNVIAIAA